MLLQEKRRATHCNKIYLTLTREDQWKHLDFTTLFYYMVDVAVRKLMLRWLHAP